MGFLKWITGGRAQRLGPHTPSPSDSFQPFSPSSKAMYNRPMIGISCP
ncbi:hypothetical protein [Burkholderia ubonensis]|nr:hypothetical protein [Burkholderia ubonensis]